MYRLGRFKLFQIMKYEIYMKIGSTHLKLKTRLRYVTLTEFRKLNATCNVSPDTAELRTWMNLKEMMQTRISGEQDF